MISLQKTERRWFNYFDYVLVDAKKPNFFAEGTIMRLIDKVIDNLHGNW